MIEALALIIFILVVTVILLARRLAEYSTNPPCQHEWCTEKVRDIYDISFGYRAFDRTEIQCQCKKCGAWKKFKV